ncbi:MAG: hypothetical protein NTW05_25525 [Pseudonocardiales bacterium]|nr:hypothetical protein [Pseudonocardiales bacterium]
MSGGVVVAVLADHPLLDTVPFFAPAFVVLGVLLVVVIRDRRRGDDPEEEDRP